MEQATINIITQYQLGNNLHNYRLVHTINKLTKTINCIYNFRDNLYVGTRNSKLYIYKINGYKLEAQKFINPHCQIVAYVIANDKFIITLPQIDDESQVGVWEADTRMFINAFQGHKSQISKAIFLTKQQDYLGTCSWDGTVRVWDLKNFQKDTHLKIYKATYPVLCMTQLNEEIIGFGGDDCYLTLWNWKKEQVIHKLFTHAGSLTNIHPFMPYVLTCGGDHKFKFWLIDTQLTDNQPNYNIKMIKEDKKTYDSNIYSVSINEKVIYLVDREGESFSATIDLIKKLGNDFEYYQSISGVCMSNEFLIISTIKGTLKFYRIGLQQKEESEIKQSL